MSLNNREKLLEFGLQSNIFGIPKPNKHNIEPFFGSGCGMMVKKDILNEIKGYDGIFYLGVDDLDFSWRMRLLGFQIEQVPLAIIYHKMGNTTKRLSLKRLFYAMRNTIMMQIKNYSFPLNFLISFLFIIRVIIESFVMISISKIFKKTNPNVASLTFENMRFNNLCLEFLKAIIWNFTHLNYILYQHKIVQKNRRINDLVILKKLKKNDLIFYSDSYLA